MELGTKPCSTCDRVLVFSEDPAQSKFRIYKLPGGRVTFAHQCKECQAEDKEWAFEEPKALEPRVDAKPFQQWLLDFVATYDNGREGRPSHEGAAEALGLDTSQLKRILNKYTKVQISTIDRVLTNSGRGTNLWELLPPEEQHQSTPKDPSG